MLWSSVVWFLTILFIFVIVWIIIGTFDFTACEELAGIWLVEVTTALEEEFKPLNLRASKIFSHHFRLNLWSKKCWKLWSLRLSPINFSESSKIRLNISSIRWCCFCIQVSTRPLHVHLHNPSIRRVSKIVYRQLSPASHSPELSNTSHRNQWHNWS